MQEQHPTVAHPPPIFDDGSSWYAIAPTPAAPHFAPGVPPHTQVAHHPLMAPRLSAAPVRPSVSGSRQKPARCPPSHARFQPYALTPSRYSPEQYSPQRSADSPQQDWSYRSIHRERTTDLGSQYLGPWGPLTAGAHAQHSGLTAYRAPGWSAFPGLTMGDTANIPPRPRLQALPAFSTALAHPRRGAYEMHAQMPDGQGVWGLNALLPHELPPHLRQSMFKSERRQADGPARGDTEMPQSFHSDAQSPGAGNTGATATATMFTGYGLDRLARSRALTSCMHKKARHSQGASHRHAKESAIPAALAKSGGGGGGGDRCGRSYTTS